MRNALVLLLAAAAWGAEDPWAKVVELKSGTELRVYKKDAKQPLNVKLDEATNERIVVVLKNEQVAIAKEEIDRIDARPAQKTSRVKRETKMSQDPVVDSGTASSPRRHPGPSQSVSSSVNLEGKPSFETVYRRTAAGTAK